MITLREALLDNGIILNVTGTEPAGIIRELLDGLADAEKLPASLVPELHSAAVDRQALGMTGVGLGYALPHARSPAVPRPILALGRPRQTPDWESIDGQPVTVILLGLSNDAAEWSNLLTRVGRLLLLPEAADVLRTGASESVAAIVDEVDAGSR